MIHDVLILGAGLCGLQAGRDLSFAKRRVLVLDKGRGVSGRAAARRWDGVPVDHGAQFFTARTWAFRAQVNRWLAHEVCHRWAEGFHQWEDDGRGLRAPDPDERDHPRYACHAGMSALGKSIADVMPRDSIQLGKRVTALRRVDDRAGSYWRAEVEGEPTDGEGFAARTVVLTMPVPQSLALLESSELTDELDAETLGELQTVEVAPTLAVLVRGTAPRPGWQGIQLRDQTLSWMGADSDKRRAASDPAAGDVDAPQVFVLHGSAEFSRQWQDGDLEEAARLMTARAGEIVGEWITRLPDRQVHRWRYASVPHGLNSWAGARLSRPGEPALLVAGDAFLGGKIEGAYLAGQEVAKVILMEKKVDLAKPRAFVWPPPSPTRGSQPGLYPPEKPLDTQLVERTVPPRLMFPFFPRG